MSWPVTARLRDFTANVTTITAVLLNGIQDVIIALYAGTKTVVSLQADGTGNSASTAASGQVKAATLLASGNITTSAGNIVATAGTISTSAAGISSFTTLTAGDRVISNTLAGGAAIHGASTPWTSTVPMKAHYGDGMPIAWAYVSPGDTNVALLWGYNIFSVTYSGTAGHTQVVLNNTTTNVLCAVVTVVGTSLSTAYSVNVNPTVNSGGHSLIDVYISTGGSGSSQPYAITVFGG